jgi:NAD-dependent dihydropyrimidine dehydrogenase PreA subunit
MSGGLTAPRLRVLVYEGRGSRPFPDVQRAELLRTLLDKGYAVGCVREEGVPLASPAEGLLMVLGRFEAGAPAAASEGAVRVRFEDVEGLDAAGMVARVEGTREEAELPRPGTWKPWFPVIDYSRCTNCMQCLSFCLFDVYGSSPQGKIQVRNQDNCKTDCPACSRVCPEVAILFPKYRHGPINGDEVRVDDIRREAMKVDISALLGGDIYSMLRDRSEKARSRFSKERDEDRALKERQTCMVKLQRQAGLDIPAEVLSSLPSVAEIRARAEAAQVKARQALEAAAADAAARAAEPES